jgi:hypothetical protein
MDPVVYSVSPLRAFSGSFLVIGFILLLSLGGLANAIFSKRDKTFSRIATGCLSLFLMLVAVGGSVATFWTFTGGDKTVAVQVNEKKVVKSNCDNGNTCTSYLLETQAGTKFYDFNVAKDAYDKVEVNTCYQFTYYPPKSLLSGLLGQEQDASDSSYESGGTITRIEKVNCR